MRPETIAIVVVISILVFILTCCGCVYGVYAATVHSWNTVDDLLPYSTLSTRDVHSVRLVVSGCVRNNAPYLDKIFAKLTTLETLLPQPVTYVFYENDSDDGSLGMLRGFLSGRRGAVIAETGLDTRYPLRTHRLAYCRNRILDYCREKNIGGADILCMMDMDDVNLGLDVGSVVKALRYRDHWDGITASQSLYYYDLWALRTKHKNSNCWNNDWCGKYNVGHFFNLNNLLTFSIPVDFPHFLRVRSAFGGLGLYHYDLALAGEYDGVEASNGKEDCEHVAYHQSLARHKQQQQPLRLFIAPFLINH